MLRFAGAVPAAGDTDSHLAPAAVALKFKLDTPAIEIVCGGGRVEPI